MPRQFCLLLVLALALISCRAPQHKSIFIDPALETLIPPDTIFVTGANIDVIRTTPVFQRYLAQMRLPQLDDFVRKTGLDPRKDLWQILSTSNGKTGLFMARGKFADGELEPNLEKNGLARSGYKGYNLFGDQQRAVMFISSSTAVAGPTSELKTLVDERDKPTHGLPPALRQLVGTIDHDRQVWAAFVGGLQSLDFGIDENSNLGQVIHVFRGIDTGTVGIDLRNGLDFKSNLSCHTLNDAKHVHDAIKGIIGIGRLSTPDNRPDLLKLYDTIQVTQDQTKVEVMAQVPPDLENKFLDLWLKHK